MVGRVISLLGKEIKGLHEAAYLLAIFAFLSQILGLIRDRLLASSFGASELLDVYYASFRIPDLIFTIVSALVSISVLIPFLVKIIEKTKDEQREFVNSIFSALIFIILVLVIAAFIFAPYFLKTFFNDLFFGRYGSELVLITRIMLIQPIFMSLSALFGSFVQVYKKFFIYAISPLLYNFGIILGIIFLYPIYGLSGLAWGVVFGSFLHFLIQIPTVKSHDLVPKLTFNLNIKHIKEVLSLSIPRTLSLTGSQISLLILTSLASTMVAGSIAVFNFAYNLQAVPMAIIGFSYALAAFPTLSKLFADGEIDMFVSHIAKAARHIIFWSIPIMVMFFVLRAQIVRTVLGAGEFSWSDTRLTAAALAIFSISVVAQSLVLLFVRGYYSAGETKKPLIYTLISVIVTVLSAFIFINIFNSNNEFRHFIEDLFRVTNTKGSVMLMLPLAYTIGQILNSILLWINFEKMYKSFSKQITKTALQSLTASLFSGYVAFGMLRILDDVFDLDTLLGVFLQGFVSGITGLIVGVIILAGLKNREIKIIWETLHKKIWKTKFIGGE